VLALTDRKELLRLAEEIRRIADGAHDHRLANFESNELADVAEGVNRLADRAHEERALLAANIESLDVTNRELRAARDQVVRSARLASVGTLAAGIAHEVGNPLGAILGFVDVARGRARKEGADTELLDAIRDEAIRIDRIVRGLLDYARPGRSAPEPKTAGQVVERVRELLERQGRFTEVTAKWHLASAETIRLDQPERLEQVLVNVLLNALHAVRDVENPEVEVRVHVEEGDVLRMPRRREGDPPELNYLHRRRVAADEDGVASVRAAERVTVIEVSDNGSGISEDALEHLFDPFFTTKEPGEGTGLGLSICARLLEGMGGTIEARADSERGAHFVIRLPMMYDEVDEPERTVSTENQ
jgi:C4-dicarboxylate-specific signal transduction histidine kinase